MYDELVKRLREPCQYENCILCQKAADAIEELQKLLDCFSADNDNLCKQLDDMNEANIALYGALPKWIPVTERLPEANEYVLVRYKNNDMAVACIFERDENFTFWRAQTDEGWCADCDTEPTHWMPLPLPPKEE